MLATVHTEGDKGCFENFTQHFDTEEEVRVWVSNTGLTQTSSPLCASMAATAKTPRSSDCKKKLSFICSKGNQEVISFLSDIYRIFCMFSDF